MHVESLSAAGCRSQLGGPDGRRADISYLLSDGSIPEYWTCSPPWSALMHDQGL